MCFYSADIKEFLGCYSYHSVISFSQDRLTGLFLSYLCHFLKGGHLVEFWDSVLCVTGCSKPVKQSLVGSDLCLPAVLGSQACTTMPSCIFFLLFIYNWTIMLFKLHNYNFVNWIQTSERSLHKPLITIYKNMKCSFRFDFTSCRVDPLHDFFVTKE